MSIDWNMAQAAAATTGSGRSRGRADVRPISVRKLYDASSPYLALACMQGKSFEEVFITVRKDSGEAHLDYLKITLTNVVISAYDLHDQEDGRLIEDGCSLSFEKIKVLYTQQADDHSSGDEHEIEFDIVAGA